MGRRKKKLTIADIKRNNNTTVPSVISRMKAKELELTVLCVILIISVIITSSYIIFSSVRKENKYTVLKTGSMEVVFNETDTGIGDIVNIVDERPIIDEYSKKLEPYVFTITNTSNKSKTYTVEIQNDDEMIKIDKCEKKLYDVSDLKYSIDNKNIKKIDDTRIVFKEKLKAKEEKTHKLRVWVSSTVTDNKEVTNKHFHGKIIITSEDDKKEEIIP
ncbi:MAG: hypothetical protein E7160_00360 [Firmicutes bacterium]|nr:hypothetical protein [Bacillota bacterium]